MSYTISSRSASMIFSLRIFDVAYSKEMTRRIFDLQKFHCSRTPFVFCPYDTTWNLHYSYYDVTESSLWESDGEKGSDFRMVGCFDITVMTDKDVF